MKDAAPWPRLESADLAGQNDELARQNDELARQLADARTQLEDLGLQFDVFAGRIAHDMQAVMQVTEGFASALSRGAVQQLGARERHYLERIVETSSRGNRLVHDLLAYARLAVRAIERRPVALADVLQRARRSVEPEAAGRTIAWTVGELPTVQGDASLLQQVFANLLSNAIQYTRDREAPSIRIEAWPVASGCEIRVHDNGMGFDPDDAKRLFQPFERLHSFEQGSSNGMGLANARRIVERHGGSVRAEGRPGEGALFAFTLPTAPAAGVDPAATASVREEAVAASTAGALRVLLVDDDPMVLISLTNMLELDGHHVDTAAGGQIGVEAFERSATQGRAHDVVITDFGMPHMDGREVARRVKRVAPSTVVILLTGWGARAEASGHGPGDADVTLGKPPRLAQVRQALAGVPRP